MHQPEGVAQLVDGLPDGSVQEKILVLRQPVELIPQPKGGKKGSGTVQLCLPEYESEYRNEEIH